MSLIILLRGGGDLASGVALRLRHAGLCIIITELPQPLVVRRLVSFAEAIYSGTASVEGVAGRRAASLEDGLAILTEGQIPVLVDPQAESLTQLHRLLPVSTPVILVDARMTKRPESYSLNAADLIIGLGPGFVAGKNCHAAVETNRGHFLGRVIWEGSSEKDTGLPEEVNGRADERVLRAPADGHFVTYVQIGNHLEPGQLIAEVAGLSVKAPFSGVLRGLLFPGLVVRQGLKVGDVDPRDDPRFCSIVSDKSLAVGGAVLEAILANVKLRPYLWD